MTVDRVGINRRLPFNQLRQHLDEYVKWVHVDIFALFHFGGNRAINARSCFIICIWSSTNEGESPTHRRVCRASTRTRAQSNCTASTVWKKKNINSFYRLRFKYLFKTARNDNLWRVTPTRPDNLTGLPNPKTSLTALIKLTRTLSASASDRNQFNSEISRRKWGPWD